MHSRFYFWFMESYMGCYRSSAVSSQNVRLCQIGSKRVSSCLSFAPLVTGQPHSCSSNRALDPGETERQIQFTCHAVLDSSDTLVADAEEHDCTLLQPRQAGSDHSHWARATCSAASHPSPASYTFLSSSVLPQPCLIVTLLLMSVCFMVYVRYLFYINTMLFPTMPKMLKVERCIR